MADKEVSNPTYMANIRHFFTSGDIACMRGLGIDLATYQGVKFNAMRIYFKVRDGEMPLGGTRWTKERVETFYNWMKNGYPRGTAAPKRHAAARKTNTQFTRPKSKRVDAATLSKAEIEQLKEAFSALMAKPEADPDSYFALAGIHWLPRPDVYCRHHENAFFPWHRIYMNRFEDALRRVPGCQDISVPYWDISSGSIPDFLFEPPFDAYMFPQDLYDLSGQKVVSKGDLTKRFDPKKIQSELKKTKVNDLISTAMGNSHWELFDGWDAGNTHNGIISAHDNGHNSCGPTMQNQDVAAFDPIFWFFHSNWDRLWWEWQNAYSATTVDEFKGHLIGDADWLDDPVLNKLPPFNISTAETINLTDFDVTYGKPKNTPPKIEPQVLMAGSRLASDKFALGAPQTASVRVKGVDRLKIPGSFDVVLKVKGKEIARNGMFQSGTPTHCATCRKKALANFDFDVPLSKLTGQIEVQVLLHRNGGQMNFPLSACGNPTVNARLLLA